MSTKGGNRAVFAALGANLSVAVAKFVAFGITGSAALLAEGIHSVVDSTNQVLLLIGGKHARKKADSRHQFGYGRVRYVYGFIVAILLFLVGGVYSLYEGVHKILHPEPLTSPWVAVGVLVVALLLEGASLRVAVKEANRARGRRSLFGFVREVRQPELPVILLEDFGALVGLGFALVATLGSIVTGNPVWDGFGAASIGVLLVLIAVVLVREMVAMLVGEAALPEVQAEILRVASSVDGVSVVEIRTLHTGPDELLVGLRVQVDCGVLATGEAVVEAVDLVEERVVSAFPAAKYVSVDIDSPGTLRSL